MSYFFNDIKPYDNRDMSSSDSDAPEVHVTNKKTSHFDQYSSDEDAPDADENDILPVKDYEESDGDYNLEEESEEKEMQKALKKTSFKKLKNMQDQYDSESKQQRHPKKASASGDTVEEVKAQLLLHKASLLKLKKAKKETRSKYDIPEEFERSDSGSEIGEGGFFEEEFSGDDDDAPMEQSFSQKSSSKKKQNKHAPKEEKMSKKVSYIRDIPGLDDYDRKERAKLKQNDIRFDKALGDNNADYHKIRNNYKFLDEYREAEIKRMRGLLKNKKELSKLEEHEVDEVRRNLQKLENKMYTLKQKDKEHAFIKQYQSEINMKNRNRDSGSKFYLKDSDKKKLLNKFKFENMDSRQRNKVMERKRKRQLGKEMKMFGQ